MPNRSMTNTPVQNMASQQAQIASNGEADVIWDTRECTTCVRSLPLAILRNGAGSVDRVTGFFRSLDSPNPGPMKELEVERSV